MYVCMYAIKILSVYMLSIVCMYCMYVNKTLSACMNVCVYICICTHRNEFSATSMHCHSMYVCIYHVEIRSMW